MRPKPSIRFLYETDRLILKIITPDYLREVLNFQIRNREAFEKYEPTRPDNFYTLSYQQSVIKCEFKLAMKMTTIRFYVFRKEDPNEIIGTVCLHDVLHLAYSCTEVGYKFDEAWQHMGYAKEALSKVLDIAFFDLSLHRVFARVMPENAPSIHLLSSLGFTEEGIERQCIQICGKWEDHIRFSYLNPYEL